MCAAAKAAKIALKLYFDAAALVIAGLSGTAEHRSYRCRKQSSNISASVVTCPEDKAA